MAKENKIIRAFVVTGALMLPGCATPTYNAADRDKIAQVDLKKMNPADVKAVLDIECGSGVNGRIRYYDDGLDIAGGKRTKVGGVDCDVPETQVKETKVTEVKVSQRVEEGINNIFGAGSNAEPVQKTSKPVQKIRKPEASTPAYRTKPKNERRKYTPPAMITETIRTETTRRISTPPERRTVFENRGDSGYGNLPVAFIGGAYVAGETLRAALTRVPTTKVSGSQSQELQGGDQSVTNVIKNPQKQPWHK